MRYDPRVHVVNPWTVPELNEALASFTGKWWLAGGMAIEWRVGRVLRAHADLDISVLADGLAPSLHALDGKVDAWTADNGGLSRLPQDCDVAGLRYVWLSVPATTNFVLQINIESGDQNRWTYLPFPQIHLAWGEAITPVKGVPTGSMAAQLLWKARNPRPADDIDFQAGFPTLTSTQSSWLRTAIRLAHPDSPWVDESRRQPNRPPWCGEVKKYVGAVHVDPNGQVEGLFKLQPFVRLQRLDVVRGDQFEGCSIDHAEQYVIGAPQQVFDVRLEGRHVLGVRRRRIRALDALGHRLGQHIAAAPRSRLFSRPSKVFSAHGVL